MDNKIFAQKRNGKRFKPDEAHVSALIELEPGSDQILEQSPVRGDFKGLIFSQSPGGCGVTVRHTEKLKVGDKCRMQVGASKPRTCEIVWLNVVDDDTIKLGVKYIQ